MKRLAKHLSRLTLLAAACSQANAISTFIVEGKETKSDFTINFIISDATGTALTSKAWSTASKLRHADSGELINMLYWNITFQYDSAKSHIHIEAFHKIDPHTSAAKKGDTFIWDLDRPDAITPIGNIGTLKGLIEHSDYKKHLDSQGKHSDEYSGTALYLVNTGEPPFYSVRRDELSIEVTGKHRLQPVPDLAPSAILLLLGLLSAFGLKLKDGRR